MCKCKKIDGVEVVMFMVGSRWILVFVKFVNVDDLKFVLIWVDRVYYDFKFGDKF